MDNITIKAIEKNNLEDLYQEIVAFCTESLMISVKPRKKYIGFGKFCGFYLFWIAPFNEDGVYFKARKSFSPSLEDNTVTIEFIESKRDEIFAAINEIYASYLYAQENGLLPKIKEEHAELRSSLNVRKKISAENPVSEHIVSLWKQLTAEICAYINSEDSYSPSTSAEEQERLQKACEDLESIFDSMLDAIANAGVTDEEFAKKLCLYRQYIDDADITLSDIGQELGVTGERVRQIFRKVEQKVSKKIKRVVQQNSEETNHPAEHLYTVLKDVEFDIISLYLSGYPSIGKRKLNAMIETLWSKNIAEAVYSIASDHFEFLRQQNREAIKTERLLLEWESFRSKICFPSSISASAPVSSPSGINLIYQFEQRFYNKIKKFEAFAEISIYPDIIYYSSEYSDYRPTLLIRFPDNTLALILIVPAINMAFAYNVEKFNQLHLFCMQNGYGYLIADSCGCSIFDIKNRDLDHDLVTKLQETLDEKGKIVLEDIKRIKNERPVTNIDIATFVLQNKLSFSPQPYTIQYRTKK